MGAKNSSVTPPLVHVEIDSWVVTVALGSEIINDN